MDDIYLAMLRDLKHSEIYLEIYLEKIRLNERVFKILLAVLSSGAVAAWAIWDSHPIFWSLIVAISQILSIVYDYLPYKQRIKDLEITIPAIQQMYIYAESHYFAVCNTYTDEEINHILYDCEKKTSEILMRINGLPVIDKIGETVDEEVNSYFVKKYGKRYDEAEEACAKNRSYHNE